MTIWQRAGLVLGLSLACGTLAASPRLPVGMIELVHSLHAQLEGQDSRELQGRLQFGVNAASFSWLEYRRGRQDAGLDMEEGEIGLAGHWSPRRDWLLYAGFGAALGDYGSSGDRREGAALRTGLDLVLSPELQLDLLLRGIWYDGLDYRGLRLQAAYRLGARVRLLLEAQLGRYGSELGVSERASGLLGLRLAF